MLSSRPRGCLGLQRSESDTKPAFLPQPVCNPQSVDVVRSGEYGSPHISFSSPLFAHQARFFSGSMQTNPQSKAEICSAEVEMEEPSHDFWVVTKLVDTHLSQFDSSRITIASSDPDAFA